MRKFFFISTQKRCLQSDVDLESMIELKINMIKLKIKKMIEICCTELFLESH